MACIKIKRKKHMPNLFCMVVLYFCYFEPIFIAKSVVTHFVCQSIVLLSTLLLAIKIIKRKKRLSKFTRSILLYFGWIILVSLLMSNLKMSLVRIIITTIGITYSYELYGFENNRKSMLYAMSLLLFINIVTHFFAYNLIDSVTNNGGWFLTGANALIVYCLPAACVALTSVEVNKERLLSVILLGVAVWTAFLSETATSIFTLTLLTAIVIVQRLIRKNIINLRVGIVAIVSVFIIVVLFQAQGKIFIIRYIVQDLLHRDLDFTARTYIWVESIKQIISSPVLGHGYGYSFRVPVGLSGFTADHAHNQYLQQFIQGGIIQGILFILVIRETIESIKGVNTRKGSCCVPSIIVTGIMFLFEYYFTASINTLFIFFYFYGKYKRENVELSVNAVQW